MSAPQDTELRKQVDDLLFKFADYIKHHERTGLGGSDHQGTTRQSIMALITKAREEAEDAITDGKYWLTRKQLDNKIRRARINERENMRFIDSDGNWTFKPYTQYRYIGDGLILDWDARTAALNKTEDSTVRKSRTTATDELRKQVDQLFYKELRGKTVTTDQEAILSWAERQLKPAVKALITKAREEANQQLHARYRADIAQAIGYCQGLGHPNGYLEKRYPDIATFDKTKTFDIAICDRCSLATKHINGICQHCNKDKR